MQQNSKVKTKKAFNGLLWGAVLFGLAAISFYIVMASPLNPRSLRLPDIDSSIFIYFGRGIRAGMMPYVDMIDHKGPLLWTIEWLGLTIGNGKMVGIWALEWIMMFTDLILLFFCARFFIKNRGLCLIAVAVSVLPIVYLYQGGNFSEEWSLPFILLALYLYLDYLKNQKLGLLRMILCGVCMGAVLCIRANMIGVWIALTLTALIRMLREKNWKLIRDSMIGFLGGICLVILPYIVYYAAKGALRDMQLWAITNNVNYVEAGDPSIFSIPTVQFFLKIDMLLYVPVVLMAVILIIRRRFDWEWGLVLFYAVSLILCTMGGRTFPHYAMVLIPCLIAPVSVVLAEIVKIGKKYWSILLLAVLLVVGKMSAWNAVQTHNDNIVLNFHADPNNDSVVDYILENSEPEDPILVMALNAYYYDATDRFANTKYFIQHYMYDDDYSLYATIMDGIEENPPRLIIMRRYNVDGDPWGEWMTRFYKEMCTRDHEYELYETDFFVAFQRKQ